MMPTPRMTSGIRACCRTVMHRSHRFPIRAVPPRCFFQYPPDIAANGSDHSYVRNRTALPSWWLLSPEPAVVK